MKKTVLFPLLILFCFQLAAQDFEIKQITGGEYDAHNPFIPRTHSLLIYDNLLFELHKGGYSNIYRVKYDYDTQLFSDTIRVTSGNYDDLYPLVDYSGGLVFQTNRRGKWDIALIRDLSNSNQIIFLTEPAADQIKPKIVYSNNPWYPDTLKILFRQDNAILYLTYLDSTINSEIIFQNDSQFTYSDYAGFKYSNPPFVYPRHGVYIAAVETDMTGNKRLVSKFKAVNGSWESKKIIVDNCDCSNPDWLKTDFFSYALFYEDTINNDKRLFYLTDWDNSLNITQLDLPFSGSVWGFKNDMPDYVGKSRVFEKKQSTLYYPHGYFLNENENFFIRVNRHFIGGIPWDTLVSLKYENAQLTVGNLGDEYLGLVYFTVWTDSVDGRIHLLGRKQIVPVGAVKGESSLNDFILFQNYPNPFNPVTKIEYKILTASDVRFEVINILGEKVFEENYGYQQSGNYTINFDGKNIPSGVYIYSVFAGENRLSRKMVLMR
jgi:hypothetical protein